MRRLEVAPVAARVADCLRRLPVRQVSGQIAGRWLWLPRLGLSVLAHEHTEAGWLCSLVAADSRPVRLPTGICVVDEVEISRAIATRWPWDVLAGLSPDEYRDTWRIRAADRGAPMALCEALLACVEDTPAYPADLYPADLDPTGWMVTIDAAVRARSGCRSTAGLHRQCQRLVDTGLLTPAETPDTRPGGEPDSAPKTRRGPVRYRLTLPPVCWPTPSSPTSSSLMPGGPTW